MEREGLTKTVIAARMQTSRCQLGRLVDSENTSVTLATLCRAAKTMERMLRVELAVGRYRNPILVRHQLTSGLHWAMLSDLQNRYQDDTVG